MTRVNENGAAQSAAFVRVLKAQISHYFNGLWNLHSNGEIIGKNKQTANYDICDATVPRVTY